MRKCTHLDISWVFLLSGLPNSCIRPSSLLTALASGNIKQARTMESQTASSSVALHFVKCILHRRPQAIDYGTAFTTQDTRRWMQDLGCSLSRKHSSYSQFFIGFVWDRFRTLSEELEDSRVREPIQVSELHLRRVNRRASGTTRHHWRDARDLRIDVNLYNFLPPNSYNFLPPTLRDASKLLPLLAGLLTK